MKHIRKRDLVAVFFRTFLVQAAWNYERMLGLGFCFCLIPIAKRLFSDKHKQVDFLKRHLSFFNSHPYMVTYALGAIANIEQQAITKKWDDRHPIKVFKKRIIGPLGAIGDTFYWKLLLPAAATLGVTLLFFFELWGVIVFLIFYNIFHIYGRIRGLVLSYQNGFDIIRNLSIRGTKKVSQIMNYLINLALGIEIVAVTAKITKSGYQFKGAYVFIISAFISFLIMRKERISVDLLLIISIISSIIVGLIFSA